MLQGELGIEYSRRTVLVPLKKGAVQHGSGVNVPGYRIWPHKKESDRAVVPVGGSDDLFERREARILAYYADRTIVAVQSWLLLVGWQQVKHPAFLLASGLVDAGC